MPGRKRCHIARTLFVIFNLGFHLVRRQKATGMAPKKIHPIYPQEVNEDGRVHHYNRGCHPASNESLAARGFGQLDQVTRSNIELAGKFAKPPLRNLLPAIRLDREADNLVS